MLTLGGMSSVEARHLAHRLRKAAARDLVREVRSAKVNAVKPLQAEIKAEAARTLPGQYAGVMAKDVKVTTQTRGTTLRVRVFARGKAELRDVAAVNAGTLRHKLFGRSSYIDRAGRKRSGWFAQRVRPGFVDRPVDELADRVLREAAEGVGDVLQKIARA